MRNKHRIAQKLLFTTFVFTIGLNILRAQTVIPDFTWLTQENDSIRPKYIWENREDYIYHELYYSDSSKMTAPEVFAIQRCPWVFNRAMSWIRNTDGTIIAVTPYKDLSLTGTNQVSAWYSDPENEITNNGNYTIFEKLNAKRYRDCAVLPSFQFHIEQNPILALHVKESTDDWQLVISIKGRSGAPVICSGWQSGPMNLKFDIARALKNKGYDLNYAELHIAIGTWNKSRSKRSKIIFEAKLLKQAAVVACLPVIRTIASATTGVPVTAIIPENTHSTLKVFASLNGQLFEMQKIDSIYSVLLPNPGVGSYNASITTNQENITATNVLIRVNDGRFWSYNSSKNAMQKEGVLKKPLTGSFQGTFFYKDAGLASEQLINSQKDWDNWDRKERPGEHQHYWESLTTSELEARFAFLQQNQWDVVHLHSHYGIWERFDASGALAPHGIEQLAKYVNVANQHNLSVMVTLSSYPYSYNTTAWDEGTTPYLQTIEKGFVNSNWYNPNEEPFSTLYSQYLRDFVNVFKDETGIFSFSSSGEGDWKGGYKRFQHTKAIIKSVDTNHIVVSEPIMSFDKLPTKQVEGFTSDIVGYRNYAFGGQITADEEMGLYVRLAQILPNSYIAEGSYPSSNLYTYLSQEPGSGSENCWTGMHEYRMNVRDWLYFGFIAHMPLIVTWDEVFTEDEHQVIRQVSNWVNLNQSFALPNVAILVSDINVDWDGRAKLGKFQKLFTSLGVDYRFIEKASDARPNDWLIDAAKPFDTIKYSQVSNLPPAVQKNIPLTVSEAYKVQYTISEDKNTMLAYIYNTSTYNKKRFYLSGSTHREAVPSNFSLTFKNLGKGLQYRLVDLDTKEVVNEGVTHSKKSIEISNTTHDYLLVVGKK